MNHRISSLLCAGSLCRAVGAILVLALGAAPAMSSDLEEYRERFAAFWSERSQVPETPPDRDAFLAPSLYDELHQRSVESFVDRINETQNLAAGMAWGSSYQMQSLNDMFAGTGDTKYLKWNLDLARATMAATDEKHDRETYYGETAPAWGSPHYHEKHTVHIVHTGMIVWGVSEFLHHAKPHGEEIGLTEEETAQMHADLTRALDFHDRQWIQGEGEGTWTLLNESERYGDRVVPWNMMSAMGIALWWSWENTGNEAHRDRSIEVARYIKNRLPIYEKNGTRAYFWNYWLDEEPVENPRPWSELDALRGGEDFSHAIISAAFPLFLAQKDVVFGLDDLALFRNTVIHGFARFPDGVISGNVAGYLGNHGPSDVLGSGYWLTLAPRYPEVYDALLPFFLNYQVNPRNTDMAKLIRHRPANHSTNTKEMRE